MVEHLLCKQGVIGSNPIVSIVGAGCWAPGFLVSEPGVWRLIGSVPDRRCWFAPESVGWAVLAVCFVLLPCESGSGASLGAQDNSVVVWACAIAWVWAATRGVRCGIG